MPAVVRIKRRIDEEPLSAFILNSKKRRRLEASEDGSGDRSTEGAAALSAAEVIGDDKDEVSTILKFAGTIQKQDDSATTQLARLTKEAAKELVLQKSMRPPSNHTERARQEMRQALHENRFRVVNCMRTTLDDADDVTAAAKEVTIVDIEKQETNKRNGGASSSSSSNSSNNHSNGNVIDKGVEVTAGTSAAAGSTLTQQHEHIEQQQQQHAAQQSTDSDTGYVYDLYLPENELQAEYVDMMDDNYLSVRPYDDLVYEDKFNNDEDEDCDSEDSNNENYYANDYPDEEDNDDEGKEYYMDSFDHEQMNDIEYGIGRMHMGNSDGFIHTFDPDDSSVPESDDSSEDYYYENDDYGGKKSDEDDDDVDYYDAGDNSDDTKGEK